MRTRVPMLVLLTLIVVVPALAAAGALPPIVTTEWLQNNVTDPELTVVDIRKVEEYREGHVPGAINVFYGTWAVKRGGLDNELPAADDLLDVLTAAAITPQSRVVVVGKADTLTDQVNATRVAWTLESAGIEHVAVLDGGHTRWQAQKRPLSTDVVRRSPANATVVPVDTVFANKAHVLARRGQALVVDTRMPDYFFGVAKLPRVDRAGRVAGAVSLPSAWIFTPEGTFKSVDELRAIAASVVGDDPAKEIIVYCDTGRLASGWWWTLSEVLGYRNVRLYDGSSQDYARDTSAPMARYGWR